jgi:DNA repair protein RecO (recombination protein O)
MPTISDNAVCIRRWDFSESSQTVSLFTQRHGIIRGLAKGAKREKGAFSGGLDVLTRGMAVVIVKTGRDLATITEWHLQESYRWLRRHLSANRAGMYMADLIHRLLTDHDPHERLYQAFVEALDGLAEPARIDASLLTFQWRLLEETGYRPQLDNDAETGRPLPEDVATLAFSARAGGVVAAGEGSGCWRVRRSTINLLRHLAGSGRIEPGPEGAVERANRLLAAYCRELIGSEPPAMRWAFPDLGG